MVGKRLETKAYIHFAKGMFTDQIWINFAPLLFEKVHILRHPGYNMAYWNLHERMLSDSRTVVKNSESTQLIFFHFSGYNPIKPENMSIYQNRFSFENRNDVTNLFKDYSAKLIENNYMLYVRYPCTFSVEKQKIELDSYISKKKTIPICKRIIRGLVLRIIKFFNIDLSYYTQ